MPTIYNCSYKDAKDVACGVPIYFNKEMVNGQLKAVAYEVSTNKPHDCPNQWSKRRQSTQDTSAKDFVPLTTEQGMVTDKSLRDAVDKAVDKANTALDNSIMVGAEFAGVKNGYESLISQFGSLDAKWQSKLDSLRPIEVILPSGERNSIQGKPHPQLEQLITYMSLCLNVFLRGPAGSGKTKGFYMACEALGLKNNRRMAINEQTDVTSFYGYMSPQLSGPPVLVEGLPYQPHRYGGGMLYDEVDAGMPGSIMSINALTDDEPVTWPNAETTVKHEKYRAVATGNTFGLGADELYVGRNRLDAASLDRFVYIDWDYDWDLVSAISGNDSWTGVVKSYFEAASKLKMPVVIGPRAAINGARLIKAGISEEEAAYATIWAKIDRDSKDKILANVPKVPTVNDLADMHNTNYRPPAWLIKLDVSISTLNRVKRHLLSGNKVAAIREFREGTKNPIAGGPLELADAKYYVENYL